MRHLGAFVSCAGGLYKSIENGNALGVNTIMIHPSPPQKWITKPFEQAAVDMFNTAREQAKKDGKEITTLYFHGIYLANMANPDKQKFHLSKMSLVEYLDLAEKVNADGVVFHVGSFKDCTEEDGYKQIIFGINWVLDKVPGTKPLLLECAAGAGNVVGDKMEELARIRDGVEAKHKDRVKFCLDTQHMYASGYDIVNDLDGVVKQIEDVLGLDNVKAVHFNDSMTDLASNKDRHENLGMGKIGEAGMKGFLNHPKLRHLDFVMETPGLKDPETAQREVDTLLSWATQ